ncbi:hypothetical protein GCM10023231_20650 [Olivibacter ginsenosidimutans]|uniref:DUF4296 domain-containing protein n=1 Tax=Olivibacter ginsenosidimutans TaxID=1176537 RepID=A0ABP9B9J9_9SPHI
MSRLIIGIFALALWIACEGNKVPKDIIPQKQMLPLLCDFHLAEGYISSLPIDSSRLLANRYYASVFKKYHTDSAGFHKSLLYYSKQPGVLDQLYIDVQKKLQQMQKDEQALIDAKMRKIFVADSIKNAHVKDSLNKIKSDSVNLRLSKSLFYWKNADSIKFKPKSWSLPLYEALVKRSLRLQGSDDEVNRLLMEPLDSIAKQRAADSVKRLNNNKTAK